MTAMPVLIDCYRDASVQQYLAVSLGDAWQQLRRKRGKPWDAPCIRHVLSLGAILESRHWLGGSVIEP